MLTFDLFVRDQLDGTADPTRVRQRVLLTSDFPAFRAFLDGGQRELTDLTCHLANAE